MFVLEKLFQKLSTEAKEGQGLNIINSYDEMLSKIDERHTDPLNNSEYHEGLRFLVIPYLKDSITKLISLNDIETSLKIFLFAFDHKIELTLRKIDWTGLSRRLIESCSADGIIVRLLRYLWVKGKEGEIEEICLLIMNTLQKSLNDPRRISFVLQTLNLLPSNLIINIIPSSNLLPLLRSKNINMNDRVKVMIIKLLKGKFGCEDEEIGRMFSISSDGSFGSNENNISALLASEVVTFDKIISPISTSRTVNLKNKHYNQFSKIEQAILKGKPFDGSTTNAYEEFLNLLQYNCDISRVSDSNILRYLLFIDKITVDQFIQHNQILTILDYELIIKKSLNNPSLVLEYLKKISILPYDLMQMNFELTAEEEDYCENLSLPAQWHLIKNNEKSEKEDFCKKMYEKYQNNFDGSGEIFSLNKGNN